jgi:flavin reductase (DIM6/NTAB) family NADH-FMN oxidoreductase RutF
LGYLICRVTEVVATEAGSRLVLGRVVEADVDPERAPLLYRRRRYRALEDERP